MKRPQKKEEDEGLTRMGCLKRVKEVKRVKEEYLRGLGTLAMRKEK